MKHTSLPIFNEFVIFATGGKQYQGIPGKTIAVELLKGDAGDIVVLDQVLLRKLSDSDITIGAPYVDGAQVTATIVKQMRGPKLIAYKFKRRKKYRVKKGHRQPITVIRIETI